MRSKEVAEAIDIVKYFIEKGFYMLMIKFNNDRLKTNTRLKTATDTVLSYIEELEKSAQDLQEDGYTDSDCKWKIKIRDKIKEYKNLLKTCNKKEDIERIKGLNERILVLEEIIGE